MVDLRADFMVITEADGFRVVRHLPSGGEVRIAPDQRVEDARLLLLDAAESAA